MTETAPPTRSLVVERLIPHSVEKIWRALTQSALVAEWLMQNDFAPVVGHRFNFRAQPNAYWNGVTDCEVLAVEPMTRLAYSWHASGEQAAGGLKTVVAWTLTPAAQGVLVRMEQSGFRPDQQQAYHGARAGWPRFLAKLDEVLAGLN
jgi:uncharacterized protein YndB with AHSA1/START domain